MWMQKLRKLPLVGGLTDCSTSDHWTSIQEFTVLVMWSTCPIWMGSILVWAMGASSDLVALASAFRGTIDNGELLLFSTALVAPIFWIALHDPPGTRAFPSKLSHIALIAAVNVIAAGFFGLQKSGEEANAEIVFNVSIWLFFSSLFLLYLGTVYNNSRFNVRGEFQRQEEDFVKGYKERRK